MLNQDIEEDDIPDEDRAYKSRRQRIDDGLECPTCGSTKITIGERNGLPFYTCRNCVQKWYDSVTQPTED